MNIHSNILTICLLTITSVTIGQTPSPILRGKDHVRGARYCEVLAVSGPIFKLTATVYNTLGCNDCPAAQWKSMNADKLKKDLSAHAIELNGPRYFLMDKISQTNAAPPTVIIGGMAMKKRATVPISLKIIRTGKVKPYSEKTVKRSTQYVFNKGSRVYELITPDHQYIMQSYAQIIDPNLTEKGLLILQKRLNLPKNWRYQTRLLQADLVLQTIGEGEAYVLQDDLMNTYQRVK